MGDNSQSCRGFETPTLGADLWPMGFDVDLALDGPASRKGPGGSLGSGGLGGGLGSLQSSGNGAGYGDMHHLPGLSSILQKFDDQHPNDICQMTDLTNSLPKGDIETAQSLLAKLACQDLGPDLSSGADPSHKELENSLFEQTAGSIAHGVEGGGGSGMELTQKAPLESAEVYGRVTCYGGKLVLQLRHINLSSNYSVNVNACWLCGEKVSGGAAQLCAHKHSLHGIFQVSEEFVQLDIEHYIIPDQALDTPGPSDLPDLHSTSSPALLNPTRDLELPENLGGTGGEGLGASLAYPGAGTEAGLSGPPLTSASSLMSSPMVGLSSSMTSTSFTQLPSFPGMSCSVSGSLPSLTHTSQPLCSLPTSSMFTLTQPEPPIVTLTQPEPRVASLVQPDHPPATSLAQPDPVTSLTQPDPPATSLTQSDPPVTSLTSVDPVTSLTHPEPPGANMTQPDPLVTSLSAADPPVTSSLCSSASGKKLSLQTPHLSLASGYSMATFTGGGEGCDPSRPKHSLQYDPPFSGAGDYSLQGSLCVDVTMERPSQVPYLAPADLVPPVSGHQQYKTPAQPRKTESGARKRKSKAQRKPSIIQLREDKAEAAQVRQVEHMDSPAGKQLSAQAVTTLSVKNESLDGQQFVRAEAGIEDWIKHSLKDEDLMICAGGSLKLTDGPDKTLSLAVKFEVDKTSSLEPPNPQPRLVDHNGASNSSSSINKPREPDQISRLAAHMLNKGMDLICRTCSKDFERDVKKYKLHMIKQHGVDEGAIFACCFCPKKFGKGKHYNQHLKTHIRTRRFSCRLCSASYSREAKLQRHMKSHSQEVQQEQIQCIKCSKTFKEMQYLQAHINNVHQGTKYKCDTCGFLCSSLYNLDIHRSKHLDDKPFKCELCEKTFVRRDFLDKHMELVHKNKRLECDACGKLFSRKDVLKRHLAVHNNQTYDCQVCGKKFSRKDRLASHSKVHKTSVKHRCSFCPASFTRKTVLKKHEKLHHIKEQCKKCFKFLNSKQHLEAHMQQHNSTGTGEGGRPEAEAFQCDLCHKSLASRDILRKHLRRMHGQVPEVGRKNGWGQAGAAREKNFTCPHCSKAFTRSCSLTSHIFKAHGGNQIQSQDPDDPIPPLLRPLPAQAKKLTSIPSSPSPRPESPFTAVSYPGLGESVPGLQGSAGTTGLPGQIGSISVGLPSFLPAPASPPSPHSHFPTTGQPESPINLSTDAITAAAYLLAYPSYPGP